jgi:GNAT superfamily N-acetyltransferase
MAPAMLRAASLEPRLFPAFRRSVAARGAMPRPPGDPWLLHTIGVDPRWQGRTIGRRLLRHGLELVDRTGEACYLQTASPAAADLFRSCGFAARSEVGIGGQPVMPTVRPAGGRN